MLFAPKCVTALQSESESLSMCTKAVLAAAAALFSFGRKEKLEATRIDFCCADRNKGPSLCESDLRLNFRVTYNSQSVPGGFLDCRA